MYPIQNDIKDMLDRIHELEFKEKKMLDDIARFAMALNFYADEETYHLRSFIADEVTPASKPIDDDCGMRARKALGI